ncbi:unnamed protein product [Zymoseptoria tritici ST99CH_3D1]|nr:unnamed protein product [Zymoseptoria tritici ST99CH_3D1]
MPLRSDLQLDAKLFRSDQVSEQTAKFNAQLGEIMKSGPKWYEVGAEKYRQMRWNGETPLPKPRVLDSAQTGTIPSRDAGRNLPTRIFRPSSGAAPRSLFLHIHGGGWVLQSEAYQDIMLQSYADRSSLLVISVGYRLAPEDPYPKGNEDCFDAAGWLVDHAKEEFGVELEFIGGDSAGAHLSALTCFWLMENRREWKGKGLVLSFGAFELSGFLPHVHNIEAPVVIDHDIMTKYIEAYLPNRTAEQRRDPWISPLYADLAKMNLPPALFLCGTADPLLDDSVFMSAKWAMSGAESILKIYPGGCHGFTFFPVGQTETTEAALKDIETFVTERLQSYNLIVHDANAALPARAAASWPNTSVADTSDPATAFATCDLLITMLPNGHIVRDVLLGKDGSQGFAAGLKKGTVVIDTSSSSPYHTQTLGKDLAELGIVLVDAPITQTYMHATDFGESTLMVGIMASSIVALCDSLVSGQKQFGLKPAMMLDVLNFGTGVCFPTLDTFRRDGLTKRYNSGFGLGLLVKDLGITEVMKGSGLETRLPGVLREYLRDALGEVEEGADHTAVLRGWEKRGGVKIEKTEEVREIGKEDFEHRLKGLNRSSEI